MTLNARDISMLAQFAKNAVTSVPATPISGIAYRDPNVAKSAIESGQPYDQIGMSRFWNAVMFLSTGIALEAERYGVCRWSPLTNYVGDASIAIGADGIPYRARLDSGPDLANVGAKDPAVPDNADYWQTLAEYIKKGASGGGGSGGAEWEIDGNVITVNYAGYPTEFRNFFETAPPAGWMVRNGALLTNADQNYPDLWDALTASNWAWKCVNEASWQAKSEAAGGVGGVPSFVIDLAAKTIRLPDTRGDYERDAGGGTMANVGDWHGDAISNITGMFDAEEFAKGGVTYSGALYVGGGGFKGPSESRGTTWRLYFDASRVVPTAAENRTRAVGVLGCVYVGGITA